MSGSAAVWSADPALAHRVATMLGLTLVPAPVVDEDGVLVLAAADYPCADWPGWECLRSRKAAGKLSAVVCCGPEYWPLEQQARLLLAGASRVLDAGGGQLSERLRGLFVRHEEERSGAVQVKRAMAELGIVGESAAIQACFRAIERAARLPGIPVLISGETGTGKEMMARAVHILDRQRAAKPFQAVNCAALVSSLLESELFGYRRGAFTGADRDRQGWLRAADGGVLFLDEIGEMDASLQAKLLRVLQNKSVRPLGTDQEYPVDVRVVSATNRPLEELVERGQFREDLYHRLHVVRIRMPALRDRPSDIAALARHFSACNSPSGVAAPMAEEFVDALTAARWPGNVRQLENVIRAAMLERVDGEPLDLSHAPVEVWRELSNVPPARRPVGVAPEATAIPEILKTANWNLTGAMEHCERAMLEAALRHVSGNQSKAAKLLGLTPRSVYNKIRKYKLGA